LNEGKEGKNEAGDDLGDSYCKLLPRPHRSMPYRNDHEYATESVCFC